MIIRVSRWVNELSVDWFHSDDGDDSCEDEDKDEDDDENENENDKEVGEWWVLEK